MLFEYKRIATSIPSKARQADSRYERRRAEISERCANCVAPRRLSRSAHFAGSVLPRSWTGRQSITRAPLALRDETESMTNPTRRIRAHGRLFSSHGNRTRDQLRDPRAVEKVTLVNRKLIPPRCLTAWCFRRSMDKRGHCSVLIIG